MHWRVKGIVQRALNAVPGGVRINNLLQRSFGELSDLERHVETKVVRDWLVLVENLRELGVTPESQHFVEVGTGWVPVLPICFSIGGAASCTTIDQRRQINEPLTFRMLHALERHLPLIAQASGRALRDVTSNYDALRGTSTLAALLRQARIHYHSPADASATGLPDGSIDVVFSNSVLEHVRRESLAQIFRESRRVLRSGGVSIHAVNCADHYAYFDRKITFINYLAYSERQWRLWNNEFQYVNRLRPRDFVEVAVKAGFDVRLRKVRIRRELKPVLERMSLAAEFRHYDPDELCSTSVLLGAIRPLDVQA